MVVDRLFIDLIVRTAQLTRGLTGAMSSSLSWASAYGSKVSAAIRKSLLVGIVGLGVLIAGAIGSGVAQASELEHQMSGVQAVLQETDATTQELKKHVMDLAVDPQLKVSAAEAAEAMEMLARNGLKAEQILGGAERATILLSNATGGSMADSADIATDAMALFNIEAKDMERVVDSITGVTTNSKLSLESYKYALAGVGGVAATMGVSLEDMNTALALASPAFADGSTLGNGFKSFLNQLIPTTKSATEAFDEFGFMVNGQNVFFDETTGQMKGMADVTQILHDALGDLSEEDLSAALKKMFGARGQIFAAQLVKSTAEDFKDLAQRVNEAGIASVNAALRIDNLSGDVEIFKSIASGLAIQLGDAVLPHLRTFVQMGSELAAAYGPGLVAGIANVVSIISFYVDAISNGYSPTAAFLDALYELGLISQSGITTLQELGNTVMSFIEPVLQWVTSFVQLRDVLTAVGIVILAAVLPAVFSLIAAVAPFIIFMGALILIIAALRTAWETDFAGIRDFVAGVWLAIQTAWIAFKALFSGDWEGFLTNIKLAWDTAWNAITTFLGNLWAMIQPHLATMYAAVVTWFTETDWRALGQTVLDYLSQKFGELWTYLSVQFGLFYDQVYLWVTTTDWRGIGQQIVDMVSNALSSFASYVGPILSGWYDSFVSWVSSVDWVAIGRTAVEKIVNAYDQFKALVGPKLQEWYDSFVSWVSGIDWYTTFVEIPTQAGESLGEFAAKAVNKLAEWATVFFDWVAGVDWASVGQTIIDAIIVVLATLGTAMIAAWSGLIGTISGFIKELDWGGIGQAIVDGIKAGVVAAAGTLIGAVQSVAQSAMSAFTGSDGIDAHSPSKKFAEFGRWMIQGLILGIDDEEATLYDKIKDVAGKVTGIANGLVNSFKSFQLDPLKEQIKIQEDALADAWNRLSDSLGKENLPQTYSELMRLTREGNVFDARDAQLILDINRELGQRKQEQADAEAKILQLQEQQRKLGFLQTQMDLINQLKDAGLNPGDILGGMKLGLEASQDDLLAAMSATMDALINEAENVLQIASPSKVFKRIGQFAGLGLQGGLLNQVSQIASAAKSAGMAAIGGLQAAMTGAIPLAGGAESSGNVSTEYNYNNYGPAPRDPVNYFEQKDRLMGLT